jgi:hypothetical protein
MGRMEEWMYSSELDESEWSASRFGRFTSIEKATIINCIEDWVGPRAGLGGCGIENNHLPLSNICRPALSLYRMNYPGSTQIAI